MSEGKKLQEYSLMSHLCWFEGLGEGREEGEEGENKEERENINILSVNYKSTSR